MSRVCQVITSASGNLVKHTRTHIHTCTPISRFRTALFGRRGQCTGVVPLCVECKPLQRSQYPEVKKANRIVLNVPNEAGGASNDDGVHTEKHSQRWYAAFGALTQVCPTLLSQLQNKSPFESKNSTVCDSVQLNVPRSGRNWMRLFFHTKHQYGATPLGRESHDKGERGVGGKTKNRLYDTMGQAFITEKQKNQKRKNQKRKKKH
ncbi:LAME_0H10990g1_1 [Lachancea meyersii CBS 8951]|uniref:LAME_0H10990g1_1 n=1 Tax=Lachancea meyersii CBS 8951 TaxID=1266667 RepID=A0A1G4KFZ1_9SACH|nr:LAME_0H10990g1_1 [Lachancea meyersii CBS 8951]